MWTLTRRLEIARETLSRRTVVRPNGCWIFRSNRRSENEYRNLKIAGVTKSAHVWAWLLHRGPTHNRIVEHTCGIRSCVNPDHLELGGLFRLPALPPPRRNVGLQVCDQCSREYPAFFDWQRWCSAECRREHYRQREPDDLSIEEILALADVPTSFRRRA